MCTWARLGPASTHIAVDGGLCSLKCDASGDGAVTRSDKWNVIDHVPIMKWLAIALVLAMLAEGNGHHGSRDVGLAMDPHFFLSTNS